MSETTITRFKLFWADQDEEQEFWLREMAQQGLHLVKVNPLCFWTFRRAAPADIVYRVNYAGTASETDFHQLMRDAGWTLAATTVGWQYWRIPAVNGKAPRIFTDAASRMKKFKQLLGVLVASATPLTVWCILMNQQGILQRLSTPSLVVLGLILGVWALLVPYGILRLLLKIRQPRGPLPG
ncbi:hypothetical protein SRABI118_02969 [Massilia sp. Bi118]|uniref:DUF2812 domain-containing protein n=1 Tax=Massilia sp. Bi118 TaxID=2822346 RepID=UPI001DDB66FF|nr:DUF2812 domain-containing protein [Massilia sp. Bi118]CAH0251132.1 hypothetical protein SRABI118_02969 [Massilia sp. Bi118]